MNVKHAIKILCTIYFQKKLSHYYIVNHVNEKEKWEMIGTYTNI